ncbi:MAG: hypothetical protein MZV70_61030 [Desulfobacterales bacterium]|nr:hypothetical protein [Desulfobacterales bacterium]
MHRIFADWNAGELRELPDRDHARHHGVSRTPTGSRWWRRSSTPPGRRAPGKWTGINSLDLGIPVTLISEAVYARCAVGPQGRARRTPPRILNGPADEVQGRHASASWKTSARRCSPPRSSPTPRASC